MRSQALRKAAARVGLVRLALLLTFLLLAGRAGQLTVANTEAAAHGRRQLETLLRLPAARGSIFDRNERTMAVTVEAPSIYVIPRLFEDREKAVNQLAQILDRKPESIAQRLRNRERFTYLARWIDPQKAEAIERMQMPGVGIEQEPRRIYPAGKMAAPVLGFADIDGYGRRGIEQMMDEWLRGKPQKLAVERDARGRLLGRQGVDVRETSGGDVKLTLDSRLQAQAEAALADAIEEHKAKSGLVIAVEPQSGDILALAEWPGFDPNDFRHTPYLETRSRAFHDALEPGSTFKPFLVAAALEAGTIRSDSEVDTGDGEIRLPGKVIHDHHPYGILDPAAVLRYSSNVGAVSIAQKLGMEAHHGALTRFGFGRPTKSGFPSESSGLLRPWHKWQPLDHATIAFGHGVNVTPIQLAMATASLANGGQLSRPRLIKARREATGDWIENEPAPAGRSVSPETAGVLLEMMATVVSAEGTGRRAALAGVRVAGKTGTSQQLDLESGRYSNSRYIAWFAGIAPAVDPKIVVVVAIHEPSGPVHTGGAVAAPLFARVATNCLARYGITTQPEPIAPAPLPTWLLDREQEILAGRQRRQGRKEETLPIHPDPRSQTPVASLRSRTPDKSNPVRSLTRTLIPDFQGASFDSAQALADAQFLTLLVDGTIGGEVIQQKPAAGTIVSREKRTIQLSFSGSREEG